MRTTTTNEPFYRLLANKKSVKSIFIATVSATVVRIPTSKTYMNTRNNGVLDFTIYTVLGDQYFSDFTFQYIFYIGSSQEIHV